VQLLEPVAHAECVAELLQPLDRERVPRGEQNGVRGQVVRHGVPTVEVGGVAVEEPRAAVAHPFVRRRVDLVRPAVQRGQATRDQDLLATLRRDRQVGHGAEAAVALPEDRPRRRTHERRPQRLRVAHDRVGPKVREVVGLLLRRAEPGEGLTGGWCRPAGAALVQQQHPVVLQRATQPAGAPGRARRPATRAALQVEQPRQVLVALAWRDHLAGEHGDRRRVGRGVVEWHDELVVGQQQAG
jgi:hypothetical protein